MTDATWFLEVASYVLITLFGAWLLWQKLAPRLAASFGAGPAHSSRPRKCMATPAFPRA